MLINSSAQVERLDDDDEDVAGDYLYVRVGHDSRPMTLDTEHSIPVGGGEAEREWRTYTVDDTRYLVIRGDHGDICRLVVDDDGIYRGRWSQFECMPIELVPARIVSDDGVVTKRSVENYLSRGTIR